MSIESEKLKEIVKELGLPMDEQSAFYKVHVGTRSVYIAKTKKVSRVDISGFEGIKHPAVKKISEQDAKDLKLGKVRAQLDFSKSEDRVLEAFRGTLEMMQHLAEETEEGATPQMAKRATKRNRRGAIKRGVETRKRGRATTEAHTHA